MAISPLTRLAPALLTLLCAGTPFAANAQEATGQPPNAPPAPSLGAEAQPSAEPPRPPLRPIPWVAVYELFTSQGCSSCPAAEPVLAEVARPRTPEQLKAGGPVEVFALAFHVDYWDTPTSRDPFSSPMATRRQKEYQKSLGRADLYTPQMIVNGTVQFLGSDRARARGTLLSAPMPWCVLTATAERADKPAGDSASSPDAPERVKVKAVLRPEYGKLPGKVVVNVAVTQSGITTAVKGGENAGKTLDFAHVVRVFETRPLLGAGDVEGTADVTLTLPKGLVERDSRLVVYAQEAETMQLLGATGLNLPGPKPEAPTAPAPAPTALPTPPPPAQAPPQEQPK
jgi:hypothetical protein